MEKMNRKKIEKEKLDNLKIDIGLQILELRILRNTTQGALAKMIGTQQPSIARAERGATTPSIDFLNKIAVALKTELIPPKFALVEANEKHYQAERISFMFNQPRSFSQVYTSSIPRELEVNHGYARVDSVDMVTENN